MAKKLYEEEKIKAIAEKIREKAESDQRFTTADMPGGVAEVYDTGYAYGNQDGFRDGLIEGAEAGRQEGYADGFKEGQVSGEEIGFINGYAEGETEGYNNGFSDGKKSEYNAFWDSYLDVDKSRSCSFAGYGWSDNLFTPPRNIKIRKNGNNANKMFYYTGIQDLAGCLEKQGVYVDAYEYNGLNGFHEWFAYSAIKHVGRIIFPEVITRWTGAFTDCTKLETVEELKTDENTLFSTVTFQNCTNLTSLNVTGVIGVNNFDVHWSTKLDKDSITSIINALSPNKTGLTVTLSQTAKDAAFTDAEWTALIATKSNWTIALA